MMQPERITPAMHNPAHLLHVTMQSIRDAVVTTDTAARVQSLNPAAEAMTGWRDAEALNMPVEAVIDLRELRGGLGESASEAQVSNPAYAALRDGVKIVLSGEALLVAKGGLRTAVEVSASPLHDAQGALSGALLILHDVSEAWQLVNRRFYEANYDSLTGLPNRILLVDRMEQATKFSDRFSGQMAILALDIDRFAAINEAHGQAAGDALLKEAAFRMTAALRESDTVCRLGADDFVILLPGVTSRSDVESLAAKLLRTIVEPFELANATAEVTCSIGISLYPQDAIDANSLMRLADAALTQAKRAGRGRYGFAGVEVRV
jgi:diguanylate cyclase (GGDEF)-like protein/PAS domain S-box-containing protein